MLVDSLISHLALHRRPAGRRGRKGAEQAHARALELRRVAVPTQSGRSEAWLCQLVVSVEGAGRSCQLSVVTVSLTARAR
jgi:hypothetical protein